MADQASQSPSSTDASPFVAHRERILSEIEFAYDRDHTMSYGYWSHECGSSFYGVGEALHNRGCTTADGYRGCTYHFGPKELDDAKHCAARNEGNEDYPMPLGPLTLSILRIKFPHLV